MNMPQSAGRSTATVMMQSLLWLWLIGLSVFVLLGYQALNDQTDQERLNTRMQRLEAHVAGLTETTQALQQRPAAATIANLQDASQALEARITQFEQELSSRVATEDLDALRAEVEQVKALQAVARAPAPIQPRPSRPAAAKAVPPPLPFRVISTELRAGMRSVSVAPSTGDFTASQMQVLLAGDTVGQWRLQGIEGSTAVFQADSQTRRVAIP